MLKWIYSEARVIAGIFTLRDVVFLITFVITMLGK